VPAPLLPVAVAVVSFDTRDHLAACLPSLADAAEVWVVDNGSSDGSPALVRERFPHVRLVEPGRNLGYGAAVDLVAARTAQPWLVAANADVVARPGALAALVAAGAADPVAGALAPRLVLPGGADQHVMYPFPGVRQALAAARPGGADARAPAAGPRAEPAPAWAVAAFLLLRTAAFREVGGFAPRAHLFAEDLDLGWRLHRAGWTTRAVPGAVVEHDESAATGRLPDRTERAQAATYAWLARRRGTRRAGAVALVNAAGALARAAGARDGAERARLLWWARLHLRAMRRARAGAPRAATARPASSAPIATLDGP